MIYRYVLLTESRHSKLHKHETEKDLWNINMSEAQDGHKMAQDGLKMAPRWLKMAPRWLQDGPKMARDGPKMAA